MDWIGDVLGLLVLADLAAVALILGWAWRRHSPDARDVAMAWSVPMAALGLTQIVDVGGALWGGGAQVLVLFAAALQTLWLSRSEEHTSELQSLMRISYAVFCLKKKHKHNLTNH